MHDTESDPAVSLQKLRLLAKDGIRIVIGPATSADLKATNDFADKNDIILFSPSSTAPSLAVEADNVFMLVADDSHQAKAISKMMWDQGIRLVIPFWRNDVYGSELMQAVHTNFQAMGGEFDKYTEKLGYASRTGHLAACDGSAHNDELVSHHESAFLAVNTSFYNLIPMFDNKNDAKGYLYVYWRKFGPKDI